MAKKPVYANTSKVQETVGSEERPGILRNVRLLGIIGLVLIAVGVGVFFLLHSRAESNRDAQLELYRIRRNYDQGEFSAAITGDSVKTMGPTKPRGLRYIVEEWGGTPAGKVAALYLGNSYLATEQGAKAKEPYEIATGSDEEVIRAAAHAGLAAVAESSRSYAEAAEEYVKASSEDHLELNTPEYLIGAARNYEQAGKTEEAIKYYRMVATQYAGSQPNSQTNLQARLALARHKVEL